MPKWLEIKQCTSNNAKAKRKSQWKLEQILNSMTMQI